MLTGCQDTLCHLLQLAETTACERSASGTNHRSQLVKLSITCAPALITSPHRSAPSCSLLNTDFTQLQNRSSHKKERKTDRKKERKKGSPPHLAATVGRITLPSRSFSSYNLINPTFVFEVTASKSNRNSEKQKTTMLHALMQASQAHSGRSRHDVSGTGAELSGAAPIPLQTVKKSAHSST